MIKSKIKGKVYIILLDEETINESKFQKLNISSDEIDFLTKGKDSLLLKIGNSYKVKFVGEYITPNNNFLSLPKKFKRDSKNAELVIRMLKEATKLGISSLLTNLAFTQGGEGIKSENYYFLKLKGFFMDFFTYEFIYPREKKMIHTDRYIPGAEPVPSETQMRKKTDGPGVTYLVKDINPDKSWKLSDIYYSTLLDLMDKYGDDKDKDEIEKMSKYLKERGYRLNRIEITDDLIKSIKSYNLNPIHEVIKQTLINYYKDSEISPDKRYIIKAFYTNNFWKVWEKFVQVALNHDFKFQEEVSKNMEPIRILRIKDGKRDFKEIKKYPDLFSKTKLQDGRTFKFIGDAKYYNNSLRDYGKELNDYQESINDKYPFVVFLPSNTSFAFAKSFLSPRGNKELLVIRIPYSSILSSVINNDDNCINKVIDIIKSSTEDQERIELAFS